MVTNIVPVLFVYAIIKKLNILEHLVKIFFSPTININTLVLIVQNQNVVIICLIANEFLFQIFLQQFIEIHKYNIVFLNFIQQLPSVFNVYNIFLYYNLFQYIIFPYLNLLLNMAMYIDDEINHFDHPGNDLRDRIDSNLDDSNQDLKKERK